MDFINHPPQPPQGHLNGAAAPNSLPGAQPGRHEAHHKPERSGRSKYGWLKWGGGIFMLCVVLLAAAVICLIAFSKSDDESKFINKDKYQAVFLNGGVTSGNVLFTAYFGHITTMNDKYIVLNDVYYITNGTSSNGQSGSDQTSNPQLTKLGCQQLHSPYDAMYINRDEVAFWENIQDSGKVVQAIKQFQKQNPNGPDCTASNSSNSQSSQPSASSPTPEQHSTSPQPSAGTPAPKTP